MAVIAISDTYIRFVVEEKGTAMRTAATITAIALVLGACGAGDPAPPATDQPPTTETTTTVPSTSPPTTEATTTTTTSTTSTTTTTAPATTTTTAPAMPGEPIDLGWPSAGDTLVVVGVRHDDVLNVRRLPGTDQPIVATLAPTGSVKATGQARSLPTSIWFEVEAGGGKGWVSAAFVAYEGQTNDATAAIVAEIGRPTAASMNALGRIVAEHVAGDTESARIVLVRAGTSGDLGEVTYDVIGLEDDSVFGLRLHIFGEPVAGGYSLRTVEETVFCGRGVTSDGLCI